MSVSGWTESESTTTSVKLMSPWVGSNFGSERDATMNTFTLSAATASLEDTLLWVNKFTLSVLCVTHVHVAMTLSENVGVCIITTTCPSLHTA